MSGLAANLGLWALTFVVLGGLVYEAFRTALEQERVTIDLLLREPEKLVEIDPSFD